jgi:hypothetical protein
MPLEEYSRYLEWYLRRFQFICTLDLEQGRAGSAFAGVNHFFTNIRVPDLSLDTSGTWAAART